MRAVQTILLLLALCCVCVVVAVGWAVMRVVEVWKYLGGDR